MDKSELEKRLERLGNLVSGELTPRKLEDMPEWMTKVEERLCALEKSASARIEDIQDLSQTIERVSHLGDARDKALHVRINRIALAIANGKYLQVSSMMSANASTAPDREFKEKTYTYKFQPAEGDEDSDVLKRVRYVGEPPKYFIRMSSAENDIYIDHHQVRPLIEALQEMVDDLV